MKNLHIFSFLLVLVLLAACGGGSSGSADPIRQWAAGATASSEFGSSSWTAMQATGAPNTVECGDYTTAWASLGYNTIEWLEVSYVTPVVPTQINIHQSFHPSQVVRVEVLKTDGTYETIYTTTPSTIEACPYVLSIAVTVDYAISRIRITVDQAQAGSWNEIDAVELVGITD
jgi:hypothetical protein